MLPARGRHPYCESCIISLWLYVEIPLDNIYIPSGTMEAPSAKWKFNRIVEWCGELETAIKIQLTCYSVVKKYYLKAASTNSGFSFRIISSWVRTVLY
jgi:hypothetical protein